MWRLEECSRKGLCISRRRSCSSLSCILTTKQNPLSKFNQHGSTASFSSCQRPAASEQGEEQLMRSSPKHTCAIFNSRQIKSWRRRMDCLGRRRAHKHWISSNLIKLSPLFNSTCGKKNNQSCFYIPLAQKCFCVCWWPLWAKHHLLFLTKMLKKHYVRVDTRLRLSNVIM